MTAVTESEATQKWCPFARVLPTLGVEAAVQVGAPAGYNRTTSIGATALPAARCIGSDCMAWRPLANRRGLCGLAGGSL